jgi:hypothetical protein
MAERTERGWVEIVPDLARFARELAEVVGPDAEAAGWRFLSLAHGDPETPEQEQAIHEVHEAFWEHPTQSHRGTRGGGDYVTFHARGPDADLLLRRVHLAATNLNPGWWHLTWTREPVWTHRGPGCGCRWLPPHLAAPDA